MQWLVPFHGSEFWNHLFVPVYLLWPSVEIWFYSKEGSQLELGSFQHVEWWAEKTNWISILGFWNMFQCRKKVSMLALRVAVLLPSGCRCMKIILLDASMRLLTVQKHHSDTYNFANSFVFLSYFSNVMDVAYKSTIQKDPPLRWEVTTWIQVIS